MELEKLLKKLTQSLNDQDELNKKIYSTLTKLSTIILK